MPEVFPGCSPFRPVAEIGFSLFEKWSSILAAKGIGTFKDLIEHGRTSFWHIMESSTSVTSRGARTQCPLSRGLVPGYPLPQGRVKRADDIQGCRHCGQVTPIGKANPILRKQIGRTMTYPF